MRGLKPELNIRLKEILIESGLAGSIEDNRGILAVRAEKEKLIDIMTFLKNDERCGFNVLSDLTAVDYLDAKSSGKRFEVIYLLWSSSSMQRVRVKVEVQEGEKIPTVTALWKGANWPEREVFDLFGIEFSGHPVMERIIMPENFRGHPLRKDFPLEGRGEDYLIESILIDSDPESKRD